MSKLQAIPKNKKLEPKLRFAGFSGEWEEKKLGDVLDFFQTNSFSRDNLMYEKGQVKNIHYGDIHIKFKTYFDIQKENVPYIKNNIDISKIKKESYCKEGDLIMADASEDYNDIGKSIELINLNNEKVVAGLHTYILRKKTGVNLSQGFIGVLMKSVNNRTQIKRIASGASVLGVSKTNLVKLNLHLPSLPEQKKIANFLSSVDEWIENLREQKKGLENYKKGMMQKIFPAKGGQAPEIRFRDDNGDDFADWEEKRLGEVANFWNGKAHEQDISENGKYIVVNSKFVSSNGFVRKYSNKQSCPLKKDDITIVMSDIPKGKAISKCFLIDKDEKYTLNQRIGGIKSEKIISSFLFRILNRNTYFLKFDNSVSQTNLRKDEILRCPVVFPSLPEQQKIANFLTSIDNSINLKQQQITQAEKWKKGLMQGLFV